ncbi:unnamed protein product [Symbiodinium sp. CCMP2456]|nr:unnamed protein product [Symbiodinium sp. CCMP2456]
MSQEAGHRERALQANAPCATAWLSVPNVASAISAFWLCAVGGLLLLAAVPREGWRATLRDPILLFFERGASPSCWFRAFAAMLRFIPMCIFTKIAIVSYSTILPRISPGGGQCEKVPSWLQQGCQEGRVSGSSYARCLEESPWYISGNCNFIAAGLSVHGLDWVLTSAYTSLFFAPPLAQLVLFVVYIVEACGRCCQGDSGSANTDAPRGRGPTQPEPEMMQMLSVFKDIFFVAVDFALDLSCMVTFFSAGHYYFGSVALVIFTWSLGQQVSGHQGFGFWSTEVSASINAGMLSDELVKITRTEKSVEAPLSLMLQTYTFIYVSISSPFALISFSLSILMSIYTIAGAVYRLLYLDMLACLGEPGEEGAGYASSDGETSEE